MKEIWQHEVSEWEAEREIAWSLIAICHVFDQTLKSDNPVVSAWLWKWQNYLRRPVWRWDDHRRVCQGRTMMRLWRGVDLKRNHWSERRGDWHSWEEEKEDTRYVYKRAIYCQVAVLLVNCPNRLFVVSWPGDKFQFMRWTSISLFGCDDIGCVFF